MDELGRLSTEQFKATKKFPYQIALDEVRSTLNVGSIFRTADALCCERMILGGLTPKPSREMNKTALGACDSVDWQHFDELLDALQKLKSDGFQIWAVEQTDQAISLNEWQPQKEMDNIIFVFGNEVMGVSDEILKICDGAIEIPQFGTKHSFNIAVSCGILLWDHVAKAYL
jgi:tRNA G18 (ribose-2'-O)-methylase SpoU